VVPTSENRGSDERCGKNQHTGGALNPMDWATKSA